MHIKTIFTGAKEKQHGIACGECQTSCQSACKTSCTVANQNCEQTRHEKPKSTRIKINTRVS